MGIRERLRHKIKEVYLALGKKFYKSFKISILRPPYILDWIIFT